jgi:hypothetical protein
MAESHEELLDRLISAAYDCGYDAATLERAYEWGKAFDIELLSEDARVGWQRHLEEAIAERKDTKQKILERMST